MYKNQRSPAVTYGEQPKSLRAEFNSSKQHSNNNKHDMQLLTHRVVFNLTKNALKAPTLNAAVIGTNLSQKHNPVYAQKYSSQKQKLLRFPAFPLKETLDKFLNTTQPLLTDSEYKLTQEMTKDFFRGDGDTLQSLLENVADAEENWLAQRWLQAAYMRYREPVTVYTSPGMTFPMQKFKDIDDYRLYAGKVIYCLIRYKQLIDMDKIQVVKMGKNELDNSQFKVVFGTCRIPIHAEDKLRYNPQSKHVVVIHKNNFFKLNVYDCNGKPLHPEVLAEEMKKIMENVRGKAVPFGILSSIDRDNWAAAYQHLQKPKENRESLNEIESALFTVSLDECVPAESGKEFKVLSEQLIHGGGSSYNGGNRWMDKTIQVVVNPNGMSGFTYEHSPAEGQPIAMMTDYITKNLTDEKFYEDAGRDGYECPKELKLFSSFCVDEYLEKAKISVDRLANNLHVNVLHYQGYGKEFLKKQKLSPDSVVQMALQYAFYKLHKVPAAQYESAHLRIYAGGRTETIRSCSNESVAFARAMCESGHSDEERVNLLRKAVESHRAYTLMALQGRGVDRHLLGLKLMALENGMPVPKFYSSPGFVKSCYFRVSTSQVATPNLAFMAYGPATPDGYACCYNPRDCDIILALSSWHDCSETCADRFAIALSEAFDSMHDLLSRVGEKPTAKL